MSDSSPHDTAHLAQMANDIGTFFRAQSRREDAVAGIANHIASFWTPRMRTKLLETMQHGDAGLDELPLEALRRLASSDEPKPAPAPGGDAG
jgi:formate dehydrogenase subunit delta